MGEDVSDRFEEATVAGPPPKAREVAMVQFGRR